MVAFRSPSARREPQTGSGAFFSQPTSSPQAGPAEKSSRPLRPARRGPRVPKTPSPRDQQIFVDVHALGRTQLEVADEYKLSQGRVSQIIAEVRQWRAMVTPSEAGEPDRAGQARLDRFVSRKVYEKLIGQAMRELARGDRKLTTTKEGQRGETKFTETTVREQAASVQWAKVALKTTELLAKLEERELPPSPAEQEEKLWYLLWHQLHKQRLSAEREGRVQPSNDPAALCDRLMEELFAVEPRVEEPRQFNGLKRPAGAKRTPADREERSQKSEVGSQTASGRREPPGTVGVGQERAFMRQPDREADASRSPANGAGANVANTGESIYESELPPEVAAAMAVRYSPAEDCAAAADRRQSAEEQRQRAKKTGDISANRGAARGNHSPPAPLPQGERGVEDSSPVRQPSNYEPPLDLGYQKPIPTRECLEAEAERAREYLKSLVPVVTGG